MVNRLVMGKIKDAFKRKLLQLGGVNVGDKGLRLIQRSLIPNIQLIDQYCGARITFLGNGLH